MRVSIALLAVVLLSSVARAQSFTLRYNPPATGSGGGGAASLSVSLSGKPIIAGDALIYQCTTSPGDYGVMSTVSNTGTFKLIPAMGSIHGGGNTSEGYIISAAAETGTDTINFVFSSSSITTLSNAYCIIWEYSYTSGTPSLDGANAVTNPASSTTLAVPSFTPSSSSSDINLQQSFTPYTAANSISSPFTALTGGTSVFAFLNNSIATEAPTWTWTSAQVNTVAQELQLGFNPTPCTFYALTNFTGTAGSTVTQASVSANTVGWNGANWNQNGTGAFLYEPGTTSLSGSLSRSCDGSTHALPTAPGIIQYNTSLGPSQYWDVGDNGQGIMTTGQLTADVNISSNIPATDASCIDSFGIQSAGTSDFINAMLAPTGGNCGAAGTSRGVQMECGSTTNHGWVALTVGTTYHFQMIWNPGGTHHFNVYSGWNGPSSPGTLVTSISCPSNGPGYYASSAWIGNQQSNTPTSGYKVVFDTLLLTVGSAASGPGCTGGSPTWNAGDASASSLQTCLNDYASSGACGDTIVIPAGTATWNTAITGAPKTGCPAYTGVPGTFPALTIQGATSCTAGCTPGSAGVGLTFADNTNITTSLSGTAALSLSGCAATSFCRVTGLTITNNAGNARGSIYIGGVHGSVGSRVDHMHVTNQSGGSVTLYEDVGNGLIDHILYVDQGAYSWSVFGGDGATHGALNWQDPTNLGSSDGYITEDSNFSTTASNPTAGAGGITDGDYGCKVTIRYSQFSGFGAGFTHGTDSGDNRSCVTAEIYHNTMNCTAAEAGFHFNPWGSRGGVSLVHDNVLGGANACWSPIELDYFRVSDLANTHAANWGQALQGLNWSLISANATLLLSTVPTLNAPPWTANHVYTCSTSAPCIIGPTSNNGGSGISGAGGFNYVALANCTSGATQPTWNQAFPAFNNGTVVGGGQGSNADNTCTWYNVGGGTAAGLGVAGFCAANPDTLASSNATCAALSPGDTASRFMDTNQPSAGNGYPYRDQDCLIHNQVSSGCYQWNNSGTQQPSNYWGTDASTAVQLNRDYFNATPAGYTPYVYPDPLQGGASGTPGQPSIIIANSIAIPETNGK